MDTDEQFVICRECQHEVSRVYGGLCDKCLGGHSPHWTQHCSFSGTFAEHHAQGCCSWTASDPRAAGVMLAVAQDLPQWWNTAGAIAWTKSGRMWQRNSSGWQLPMVRALYSDEEVAGNEVVVVVGPKGREVWTTQEVKVTVA